MLPLLLLNVACVDKLEAPPPLPTRPNRMDTVTSGDVDLEEGRNQPPKFLKVVLVGARNAESAAGVNYEVVDPEGQMVRTDIKWFVDDARVSGEESFTLASSFFSSGQRVYAELVANDGVNRVTRRTDQRTVGNQRPTIEMSGANVSVVDGLQVKASDPDGDALLYRLEDGPPGMRVDAEGVIHWTGAVETEGSWRPKVIVSDGHGEEATWEFSVDVSAGAEERNMSTSEARGEGLIE
ncbi:MAG TPA: hypothetical protein QGF58_09450 [Myxococcota bacterium]|nr:hypothetical protein [Myxococcota bacterium]